jgi:23S rRNA (adenine2503-C2)-methyltransferase
VDRIPLTPRALRLWLAERGEPQYRAAQVLAWVYRNRATSFASMANLPRALRTQLQDAFFLPRLTPTRVVRAADGTRKFLFTLDAGAAVESVLIPDPPRLTLCISSQAGCAMGCAFCATARLGLVRNLSAAEIAGQAFAAQEQLGSDERITNVVFMGMGEPLANCDAVVEAVEILTADWGVGLSGRRVTVSTVGLVPGIERLVRETSASLAVSLSATTDAERERLMPVNRRYPLRVLLDTCRSLPIPQRRRITFEYVLLKGVNDSNADARRLAALLHGIRSKVNLIPFNPFPGSGFESPPPATVREFQEELLGRGVHATVRQHRGRDIQAACGQLALAARRRSTGPHAEDPAAGAS